MNQYLKRRSVTVETPVETRQTVSTGVGVEGLPQELSNRISRLVGLNLIERPTVACAASLAAEGASTFDSLLGEIGADMVQLAATHPEIRLVACREGCVYCCHGYRISALTIEIVRLAAFIKERFSPDQIAGLIQRLRDAAAQLNALPSEERMKASVRCPVLGPDNRCSAYEARPLSCRIHHSVSVDACASNVNDRSVSVPMIPAITEVGNPIVEGLHLGTVRGELVSAELELVPALLLALETDATERWLKGEDPWASARDDEMFQLRKESRKSA